MLEQGWFQRLLQHIEQPTPPYAVKGETALAFAILPLAFAFQLLDSLYDKSFSAGQSLSYVVILALFTAVAFSSVFALATPPGERWVRRMLAGKRTTAYLAALPLLYVGLYLLTLWAGGFPELYTAALKKITDPWSRLPLPLFFAVAAILLYGCFRGGLALARRADTNAAELSPHFGWRQFGCVLFTAFPYLVLQEVLPLLWCFSTPAALIVMMYGTGLGREYFGFTFMPRSRKEALFVAMLLISGLMLFLATNFIVGGIAYTGGLWQMPWWKVYTSTFMMLFIVGISEEVIFRCGILTLFASLLARFPSKGCCPRSAAAVATSLLFGIAHFPHGPLLMFLAFLASLLYGLAFVGGKSLFGPVLLHGLLNVLLLKNFQLLAF